MCESLRATVSLLLRSGTTRELAREAWQASDIDPCRLELNSANTFRRLVGVCLCARGRTVAGGAEEIAREVSPCRTFHSSQPTSGNPGPPRATRHR